MELGDWHDGSQKKNLKILGKNQFKKKEGDIKGVESICPGR